MILKKKLHLGPIWTGKNNFVKFFVFAKILAKTVCPRSQWNQKNFQFLFIFSVKKIKNIFLPGSGLIHVFYKKNCVLILAFSIFWGLNQVKKAIFQSEILELGSYNNLAHYDHFFFLKNYSTLLFIDLVGPVYLSKKSYTRMPVMIDRSTRWAQVSLVKILNSKAVLNSFTFTWVARYRGGNSSDHQ